MQLDLLTGVIEPSLHTATRRYKDLLGIFENFDPDLDPETIIYQTYGSPGDAEGERLLYGTTVLMPGAVCGEQFMTRGHVHIRPDRGELCLTLEGSGILLLASEDGSYTSETMNPGSIHDIDGRLGHRVLNTGNVPLVFFVTWMSDCGHDYTRMTFPRITALNLESE